jgi:hypothetical protein
LFTRFVLLDLELVVSGSFPEPRDRVDDDAVHLLRPGSSVVDADLKRRSFVWTLPEDMASLTRINECGGLYQKLTSAWFRSSFSPMLVELVQRFASSFHLREDMLFHIAKAHREGKQEVLWDWPEEKHEQSAAKDYYSYEQDLVICQLVVVAMLGRKLHKSGSARKRCGTCAGVATSRCIRALYLILEAAGQEAE